MSTKDYIVHIDQDGDLDWETTQEYDREIERNPGYVLTTHNSILNGAAVLEVTPCDELKPEVRRHFTRLIGQALACCFDLDYLAAQKALLAAGQYIKARSEEKSRQWYLASTFCAAIPFLVLGAVLWIVRDFTIAITGPSFFWVALTAIAGTVGALFSVIARTGKLKFDCSAGKLLHYLEGTSRIFAGFISGCLAGFAVKSGVLFEPLIHNGHFHDIMLIAGLIAGTGERLATSIISKFDSTHVGAEAMSDRFKSDGTLK